MGSSVPNRKSSFPVETTSFVGRRKELADAKQLLSTARLLNLIGPGGVGKSRLSVRIAARLERAFPDGAWLVPLAGLQDEELVPLAVAHALDLHDYSDRSPLEALVDHLRDRRLLVVLDNCEHVLDACARVVGALLEGTRGVRILVTSRHRLGVTGEHLLEVSPLRVPDPNQKMSTGKGVAEYSALTLFAQRAAAVQPGFTITDENQETVARLCRRLDGLPLAIELAAVRMRVLGIEELVERLNDRYRLLTGGGRAILPRHKTLRATVDWSYGLCTQPEQLVWTRASVFRGSFELAAAEAVCAGEGVGKEEVLYAIVGLIDKSLLIKETGTGRVRYRMLDTIRDYGMDRLRETNRAKQTARRQHRDWYLGLATECERKWFGPRQREIATLLEADQDNLHAALDFCLTTPGQELAGLRIAGSLWFYWHACGARREGQYWLPLALEANPEPTRERARALWVARVLAVEGLAEEDLADESHALATRLGDAAEVAHAEHVRGVVVLFRDDLERAREMFAAAIARPRVEGQLMSLAVLDHVELAATLAFAGEPDRAIEVCLVARPMCTEHGEEWVQSYVLRVLALAYTVKGEWATADTHAREALRLKHGVRDLIGIGLTVDLLVVIVASQGDHERAAVLLGVADRIWRDIEPNRFGSENYNAPRRESEARARDTLGATAFERAYDRGRRLGLDEGVAYALARQARRAALPSRPDVSTPALLTRREAEVAGLVAEGLTSQRIADRLVISRRTAESHVQNILTKLGFNSRSQIAAWVIGPQRQPADTEGSKT